MPGFRCTDCPNGYEGNAISGIGRPDMRQVWGGESDDPKVYSTPSLFFYRYGDQVFVFQVRPGPGKRTLECSVYVIMYVSFYLICVIRGKRLYNFYSAML